MDNKNERWALIEGFDSVYMVSNLGRLKSLSRYIPCKQGKLRLSSEKILKPQIDKLGYCRIGLHKNNEFKLCLIHRLVAKSFIPNPEKKPCVNHKNGNPSDNTCDNLEWCTYKENSIHSFNVLKRKPSGMAIKGGKWPEHKKGVNHHNHGRSNWSAPKGEKHPFSKKIKCTTLDIEFVTISSAAESLGLYIGQISNVLRSKYRQTHGLVFRYI